MFMRLAILVAMMTWDPLCLWLPIQHPSMVSLTGSAGDGKDHAEKLMWHYPVKTRLRWGREHSAVPVCSCVPLLTPRQVQLCHTCNRYVLKELAFWDSSAKLCAFAFLCAGFWIGTCYLLFGPVSPEQERRLLIQLIWGVSSHIHTHAGIHIHIYMHKHLSRTQFRLFLSSN